jgi:hypothetical protein
MPSCSRIAESRWTSGEPSQTAGAQVSEMEGQANFAERLTAAVDVILSESEEADCRALEHLLLEGISLGALPDLAGERLHSLLVRALADIAFGNAHQDGPPSLPAAVELFLVRAAKASPSFGPGEDTTGGR